MSNVMSTVQIQNESLKKLKVIQVKNFIEEIYVYCIYLHTYKGENTPH